MIDVNLNNYLNPYLSYLAQKTIRLRITANPFHTEEMVNDFVDALCTVLTKYNVYDLIHKKISFG